MGVWREVQYLEPLMPHVFEDHLCEQMERIQGIGGLSEVFVEQSR